MADRNRVTPRCRTCKRSAEVVVAEGDPKNRTIVCLQCGIEEDIDVLHADLDSLFAEKQRDVFSKIASRSKVLRYSRDEPRQPLKSQFFVDL